MLPETNDPVLAKKLGRVPSTSEEGHRPLGGEGIMKKMAERVIHISEAEAASNFNRLLACVRAGAEVVIEHNAQPVAVLRAPAPVRRTISECMALLPEHSTATIDADFAKDVEAAI
jgi:antitoxin (DNA-binding transcriptional repressor) of toxin-antitoxin stability system